MQEFYMIKGVVSFKTEKLTADELEKIIRLIDNNIGFETGETEYQNEVKRIKEKLQYLLTD